MKNIVTLLIALTIGVGAMAQQPTPAKKQLPQPFKGGIGAMTQFFKDSLQLTTNITNAKASGLCIFKFTADVKGNITSTVVYFADDYLLTQPIIEAIKKSSGKWVIPELHKSFDFILPVSINFVPSGTNLLETQKAMYNYYLNRKPIRSADQIPLNSATLLPTIVVNYGQ